MNTRGKSHRMSFEERRCQVRCLPDSQLGGKDQFERDWEVFVARYDAESRNYVTKTYWCEDVIAN